MTLPTWDLFITLFFLIALAYGFILGRGRIVIILVITYVAFVVALETGSVVYTFFAGPTAVTNNIWVESNVTLFIIRAAIFASIVVLVSIKGELGALTSLARGLRSTLLTGVYAFFNAGLIISCIIKFLPEESQATLFSMSSLAAKVDSYRSWWLVIPVIVMIIEGFFRGKEEAKEK